MLRNLLFSNEALSGALLGFYDQAMPYGLFARPFGLGAALETGIANERNHND